jgi:hypothetical protein
MVAVRALQSKRNKMDFEINFKSEKQSDCAILFNFNFKFISLCSERMYDNQNGCYVKKLWRGIP